MIKLVACDLDGTLFNSNMTVSEANAQAVKNAQKSENAGKFAFYATSTEGQYLIYNVDSKVWVSYDQAYSYSNGPSKAKLISDKASAQPWKRSQMVFLSWAVLGRSLLGLQRPCYPPKPPGDALVDQLHRTVSSRQDPLQPRKAATSGAESEKDLRRFF